MRRKILMPLPVLLSLIALAGCGSTSKMIAGKPWFQRDSAKEDLLADNPLRKRPKVRSGSRERDSFRTAKPRTEVEGSSEAEALSRFDPDLVEMIEAELSEMPPEERRQFFKDIVSLQPAMVRQIIKTRRIVRQIGQDAPTQLSQNSPERGGVRLTAGQQMPNGETEPAVGRNPARDPGLGAIDPWDRKTQSRSGGVSRFGPEESAPPAPLPFNQIPAVPGTGHSAGYNPGGPRKSNPVQMNAKDFVYGNQRSVPEVQPPPGASTPSGTSRSAASVSSNAPRQNLNARVPYDYNPLAPPVPNYGNQDPFAGGESPARVASQNPDQRIPGVMETMGIGDSFTPPAENADNENSAPADAGNWQMELNRLIASAEAQVGQLRFSDLTEDEQKTAYIRQHVYLRMLYLMAGQEARAVTAIPEIPAADQEFWQQTFWAMSNYFDTNAMPEGDYRATQTIAQLKTAIQKLQEKARLELRNVAFCHKISSFGNFDRFPRDEFGPGQPVLVYAEVTNFKSEPTTKPTNPNQTVYRTQLKSSIEIHRLGPAGELVERFEFEPTEDLCHNHRRDYFHSYEFTIPQRISLGPHVMTLTVEDQLSRKIATYRLNFMVK